VTQGTYSTRDWALATFLSYAADVIPTSTKVQGKVVFHFQEQDSLEGYSFNDLQKMYYSREGAMVQNARDLLNSGKDIRTMALSTKEEK
jgi:hypothetical protein